MTKNLGTIAATALRVELRDEQIATADHLSSVAENFRLADTSPNDYIAGLGKIATNVSSKSSFGGTTI